MHSVNSCAAQRRVQPASSATAGAFLARLAVASRTLKTGWHRPMGVRMPNPDAICYRLDAATQLFQSVSERRGNEFT